MSQNNNIKEIWEWVHNFKKECANLECAKKRITNVLTSKITNQQNLPDFLDDQYTFPSSETERIANTIINFSKKEFGLLELFASISENIDNITEINFDSIILLISDVLLYKIYQTISQNTYGGFFNQLNICIILDAMKIKPDDGSDISTMLSEVNEKAILSIEKLNEDTIWAIAMLNYKMHNYNVAISFFNRFIYATQTDQTKEITFKQIRANIYIGYCFEKSTNQLEQTGKIDGFSKAIDIFTKLLKKLNTMENIDQSIITELHHGLGHFYNERAVFGNSDKKSSDITKARQHMKQALQTKVDYYSCYGSLFHEYGDFETAKRIFEEASNCEKIKNNNELKSEMNFYKAQTNSSLTNDFKSQINEIEMNFNSFEKYCKETFNYDGIIHARIFKTRSFLRKIEYGAKGSEIRKKTLDSIDLLYKQLTEYTLSNYASESIKNEYEKTKCILDVFRSLYADEKFIWHMEDLQYSLQNYIRLMPPKTYALDYKEKNKNNCISNLYQISINNLKVWCVSSKKAHTLLKQKRSDFKGINIDGIFPIENILNAHNSIKSNGIPDIVVLIPPIKKDDDFEKEVDAIIGLVSESYFFFYQNTSSEYSIKWLKNRVQGKKYTLYYSEKINEIVTKSYCYRALEVLRKELLQPIPLFSLAPTHFSSSYDFQLGEAISIQSDYLNETIDENEQKKLLAPLSFIDKKYSSNILDRKFVNDVSLALENFNNRDCCSGDFIICFPAPNSGISKEDNYISYCVNNTNLFSNDNFSHNIETGEIYTIKALPSYNGLFWDLEATLESCADECENNNICSAYCEDSINNNSDVAKNCRKILNVIFNEKTFEIKSPYKCILKKTKNAEEKEMIFLIIQNIHNKPDIDSIPDIDSKPITVFVTYAWEPEGLEFEKYQKEVREFTNRLRSYGYDATFDLAESSNNWTQIMIQGLQKDKIIVLLSKEYKRKADKTNSTGVSLESKIVLELLRNSPQKIILAKLPSQSKCSVEEIRPIIFSGENIIDLSKNNITDGYNLLYARLEDIVVGGDLDPISGKKPAVRTLKN